MSAAQPKLSPHINLNLLYPQGSAQRIYAKFFKWLISYGRFIVVVVEVVVLVCFGMRFKLDNDLGNLTEEVNNKAIEIEGSEGTEIKALHLQQRLKIVKDAFAFSTIQSKVLTKIARSTPVSSKLSNVSFDIDEEKQGWIVFKLTAQTVSSLDISGFLYALRNNKSKEIALTTVKLTNVSFDQGNLVYTITGSSDGKENQENNK